MVGKESEMTEMMYVAKANRQATKEDIVFSSYTGKRELVLKQLFSSREECIEYMYKVFGVDIHKNIYAFQSKLDAIVAAVA
jgi:hypothetical protein